jgi:hypothetical protein
MVCGACRSEIRARKSGDAGDTDGRSAVRPDNGHTAEDGRAVLRSVAVVMHVAPQGTSSHLIDPVPSAPTAIVPAGLMA